MEVYAYISDPDAWFTTPNSEYLIRDLECEDTHYTALYAREDEEGWEYASVRWRYQYPNFVARFRDGKVSEPAEE